MKKLLLITLTFLCLTTMSLLAQKQKKISPNTAANQTEKIKVEMKRATENKRTDQSSTSRSRRTLTYHYDGYVHHGKYLNFNVDKNHIHRDYKYYVLVHVKEGDADLFVYGNSNSRREIRSSTNGQRTSEESYYSYKDLRNSEHGITIGIYGYHYSKFRIEIYKERIYQTQQCQYTDPIRDLHWLKQIKDKHPSHKICEYKYNGEKYFMHYQCGITHWTEYWYDCYGQLLCEYIESPNGGYNGSSCEKIKKVKKSQPYKCWVDPCKGGCPCPFIYAPVCGSDGKTYDNSCLAECAGVSWNHGECEPTTTGCHFDVWFEKPVKRSHRWYVKLNVEEHHRIEYVELYRDGHFVGKETSHPYDWGKQGKDRYLTNLRHGRKYKLHAKVYTTDCGVIEEHYEFRVGG